MQTLTRASSGSAAAAAQLNANLNRDSVDICYPPIVAC
jgi:hypothetical protein